MTKMRKRGRREGRIVIHGGGAEPCSRKQRTPDLGSIECNSLVAGTAAHGSEAFDNTGLRPTCPLSNPGLVHFRASLGQYITLLYIARLVHMLEFAFGFTQGLTLGYSGNI